MLKPDAVKLTAVPEAVLADVADNVYPLAEADFVYSLYVNLSPLLSVDFAFTIIVFVFLLVTDVVGDVGATLSIFHTA